jgi:chemotaxis protein methyltransferase CheR
MTTPFSGGLASSGLRPGRRLGEFLFTEKDFRWIAATLHADAGINLPDSKAALVYSRLAKRLRTLGLRSFKQYCSLLEGEAGADERQRMIAALTTNVTGFFREPHHFEHLKSRVLPPLLGEARRGGRVRIWSAGCSSGEEPYSIALSILQVAPDAGQWDVKVLATDINTDVLETGRQGVYTEESLGPAGDALVNRWFRPVRGDDGEYCWQAGEELRALVAFRELNLTGPWPMRGRFDAIFCRNVVIYFDETVQQGVWNRFAPILTPRGWLYIGHSERLIDPDNRFERMALTTYRVKEPLL